jgi:hypothetical protein
MNSRIMTNAVLISINLVCWSFTTVKLPGPRRGKTPECGQPIDMGDISKSGWRCGFLIIGFGQTSYDVARTERRHDIRGGHDDLGLSNHDVRGRHGELSPSWRNVVAQWCRPQLGPWLCVTVRGVLINILTSGHVHRWPLSTNWSWWYIKHTISHYFLGEMPWL